MGNMVWKNVAQINLAWWNTGLSPPIIRKMARATSSNLRFAIDEVARIRAAHKFNILGMCEIEPSAVESISSSIGSNFRWHSKEYVTPRKKSNLAIIYDSEMFELVQTISWTDHYGPHENIKSGEQFTFYVPVIDKFLHVVASHWPSLRTLDENSSHRREIAAGCRARVAAILEEFGDDAYVVMMGDYNAEPFSLAMAEHLYAIRDRKLVQKGQGYLYNPFWRCLGESIPFEADIEDESIHGTCYHPADKVRRWAMFDQILFSENFLRESSMILREASSAIFVTPELRRAIRTSSSIFDHYPVLSSIQLRV